MHKNEIEKVSPEYVCTLKEATDLRKSVFNKQLNDKHYYNGMQLGNTESSRYFDYRPSSSKIKRLQKLELVKQNPLDLFSDINFMQKLFYQWNVGDKQNHISVWYLNSVSSFNKAICKLLTNCIDMTLDPFDQTRVLPDKEQIILRKLL